MVYTDAQSNLNESANVAWMATIRTSSETVLGAASPDSDLQFAPVVVSRANDYDSVDPIFTGLPNLAPGAIPS